VAAETLATSLEFGTVGSATDEAGDGTDEAAGPTGNGFTGEVGDGEPVTVAVTRTG
jgi:hypothetical protein